MNFTVVLTVMLSPLEAETTGEIPLPKSFIWSSQCLNHLTIPDCPSGCPRQEHHVADAAWPFVFSRDRSFGAGGRPPAPLQRRRCIVAERIADHFYLSVPVCWGPHADAEETKDADVV